MSLSSTFWIGFASGAMATGRWSCFIAAAVLRKRSSEASRYVRRRYS
jgi:hypothetical protein